MERTSSISASSIESRPRVDDDHVASESRRLFEAVTCDVDRLRGFGEDVDADLGTEDAKLFDAAGRWRSAAISRAGAPVA